MSQESKLSYHVSRNGLGWYWELHQTGLVLARGRDECPSQRASRGSGVIRRKSEGGAGTRRAPECPALKSGGAPPGDYSAPVPKRPAPRERVHALCFGIPLRLRPLWSCRRLRG